MQRDQPLGPGGHELQMAHIMRTARQLIISAGLTDPLQAASVVQAAINLAWPDVVPETARDLLTACAGLAVQNGHTTIPGVLIEQFGDYELTPARDLLDMTAEWAAAGEPAASPGGFTPPLAYASSTAFDRGDDELTKACVIVLLVLAHLPAAR